MRWGVREEATADHKTTELCLQEIRNCQRLSRGPNFVVNLSLTNIALCILNLVDGQEKSVIKDPGMSFKCKAQSQLQQTTFFFFFSKKTSLDISCESSAWQMIHMKCQDLFSLKNEKKNSNVIC